MLKCLALVSLLATGIAATAQSPTPPSDQAPAPIVRAFQSPPAPPANPDLQDDQPGPDERPGPAAGRAPLPRHVRHSDRDPGLRPDPAADEISESQPISGVWLRSRSTAVLKTISATPQGTEIRLERGILNVTVHQPAQHTSILIDLPGGQTSLVKDGLYTFNADTNTVRVLHGEAAAFPAPLHATASANAQPEKPIKIKGDHQLAFAPIPSPSTPGVTVATASSFRPKSVEAYPYELAADLLPANHGDGNAYANVSGFDGPYGYPYYAGGWGYPYGYGYPYGFYPYGGYGYGIGIGYYGGFRGGYRGGYGGYGGFRGGGGHGFGGGGRGFHR